MREIAITIASIPATAKMTPVIGTVIDGLVLEPLPTVINDVVSPEVLSALKYCISIVCTTITRQTTSYVTTQPAILIHTSFLFLIASSLVAGF